METIGHDLRVMQRIPLAPAHVEAIRAAGTPRRYAKGDPVVEVGAPVDRFVYVEEGEIEVLNPFTGERLVSSTLGPTQFMGEIALLSGGTWSLAMRRPSNQTDQRSSKTPCTRSSYRAGSAGPAAAGGRLIR